MQMYFLLYFYDKNYEIIPSYLKLFILWSGLGDKGLNSW